MKKINIKDIELNIDIISLLELKNVNNKIIIDINGTKYINEEIPKNKAIIYINENYKKDENTNDIKSIAKDIFAKYKPVITGTICKIKPLNNWQKIIGMNAENMLYFDHQSDGVEIFEDSILEDYGWHASALEINYRAISDFIEDNCNGTLLCYDNEIQFNGFALVDNIEETRAQVKSFIIEKTKENIKDGIIELDDDDVIEALEFFKLEIN
ncbi:hypothetical protein [Poseidonibacter ostreae]|jgi:hypothetical protein|uniref:Uncharacterized protein n=1 Tax=Poseidonibacter ostreae TaxID=2654171 RepID=A0A6L4WQQ2_9BACT|nr:hypothetical protein [Poseidonibacter ostreae]KAB7887240.1 hypothetical protein GBG19_10910 [Poseidonibacter ostreae]KAB7888297.1 hypothetical protein GA417_00535 [Poseidonibacter ostreae]KAB7889511.1 hypothetical protein GBG18_10815 [Poseidonibacter ostreae]MAC82905.1 hypothetical protein [Arcobacter sp.]|tara:strand:+ start:5880 stop:6515 length:636 start_codon:yes stop_codon:yes gene_type:complete